MKRALALICAALALAACGGPSLPKDVNEQTLADAIGTRIGSPGTCVLIGDAKGAVVWMYADHVICGRTLPSCEGAATLTADQALKDAVAGNPRTISCPSDAAQARDVAWVSGKVPPGAAGDRGLYFVAVMEGDRALPSREVSTRIRAAFAQAGL